VQVVILYRNGPISVQTVSPMTVCRERNIHILCYIREVQHHHEAFQPLIYDFAPTMINDHLPLLIDTVATRREIVPVPIVVRHRLQDAHVLQQLDDVASVGDPRRPYRE
jgi:hypothetical protein